MKIPLVVLAIVVLAILAIFGFGYLKKGKIINLPKTPIDQKEKPLEKYTYDVLSKTKFAASKIELGEVLKDEADFTSRIFYFWVDSPSTSSGQGKKVSGLVNIPKAAGTYPVVVMFRGYVDKEIYTTGTGTQHTGEIFARPPATEAAGNVGQAQNGFITLAPDFLGYGQSENPSVSPIEERFQTYTTALTLLESIDNLNQALGSNSDVRADQQKIGIWGHSNGGQIALSVLEISGKEYPTVLWAPVSKPFPYSILYYTDEYNDHGKMLRRVVSDFEKDYDVEDYSPTNFFDRINAPIQLHQGTADESVPQKWSDQLAKQLKEKSKEVEYFTYPGADHNLAPDGWSQAVQRSVDFYHSKIAAD